MGARPRSCSSSWWVSAQVMGPILTPPAPVSLGDGCELAENADEPAPEGRLGRVLRSVRTEE